jgi:hypothetical protein
MEGAAALAGSPRKGMLRARAAVASAATIFSISSIVACDTGPTAPWRPTNASESTDGEIRRRQDHATTLELEGLKTRDAREEYARLTSTSCERDHVASSCVKASTIVDARVGKSLLFHGCSLGGDDACIAYMSSEMKLENKKREQALADAQQALALGCSSGKDDACKSLRSFDGYPSSTKSSDAASKSYTDKLQAEVRDAGERRGAQAACIAACTEEQKACKHRCSISGGAIGSCVSICSDTSIECARSCRARALADCIQHTRGDCDFLR